MQTADQELLERWYAEGDAGAFRELTSRYANLVFAAARRVLGDTGAAEDVAQECFEALASKSGERPRYLGAWLHTAATNRALTMLDATRRRRARELRAAEASPSSARGQWDDIYEHVDAAIAELPEVYRVAVVGHFLEGQGKAELARALGVSRPTIHYRIDKGLERVRHALRQRGVTASAGALTAALAAQASEAAPAGLIAALGKIAVAGAIPGTAPVTSGAGASVLGYLLAKKALLAGIAAVVVSGGLHHVLHRHSVEPVGESASITAYAVSDPMDDSGEAAGRKADDDTTFVARSPFPTMHLLGNVLDPGQNWPARVQAPLTEETIAGRVVDVRGNPVAGAAVIPMMLTHFPGAQTDSEGRFRLEAGSEDLVRVLVRHARFSERTVSGMQAGDHNVTIVLDDRVRVSGRVVDARTGMAISTFKVTAQKGISSTIERPAIRDSHLVNDPRGVFELNAVEAGKSTIVIESDGFVPAFAPVHLESDTSLRDLVIALQSGAVAEGRVTDADGKPVEAAFVYAGKDSPSSWSDAAMTDKQGRFSIRNLRGDEATLYARDTVRGLGVVDLHWNRALHLRGLSIVLVKEATGALEVSVAVNGNPAVETGVGAGLPGASQRWHAQTGPDGVAVFAELPPGPVQISAGYPGQYGPGRSIVREVLIEAGKTATASLDFAAAVGAVAGQVRFGNQSPDGCFVQLEIGSDSDHESLTAPLKVGGYFDFASVVGGEGVLKVNAEFGGQNYWRTLPVRVDVGETRNVDIDFSIAGAIQGLVAGVAEHERGSVKVFRGELETAELNAEVLNSFGTPEANGVLNPDGSYAIEGIAPGRYTVVATILPDSGSAARDEARFAAAQIDIAEGETSIIDIELGN